MNTENNQTASRQTYTPDTADLARLQSNPVKIYILAFFQVFLVILPIAVPFFQSKGLSMQEVFMLQAIFGAVIALSEIPSGYLADLWSRKNALLLGAILCGVGHTLLLVAQDFWTLVAFEIFLGMGTSLLSGADIAVLYDTKTALGHSPASHNRGIGNLFFMRTLSEAASAVLCSLLLIWSMQHVVFMQAFVGWIPFVVALTIFEPPVESPLGRNHLHNFRQVARVMLFENKVMRLTVLALAFWSLTTFYIVWLLQKYWENIGIALLWFGYLWAGYAVISGIAGRFSDRAERVLGAPTLMLLIGALPLLGAVGMVWSDALLSLAFATCFFVARGLGLVTLRSALNSRIHSSYRATANSLASFAFRGGFVITGPILGYVLDFWGMEMALYAVAGYSFIVLCAVILPLSLALKAEAIVRQ